MENTLSTSIFTQQNYINRGKSELENCKTYLTFFLTNGD